MSFIKFEEEIDGSNFYTMRDGDWYKVEGGVQVEISGSDFPGATDFYLFESIEDAGEYARDYWKDYIEGDPDGAVEILGAKTLIAWALGQWAGPGHVHVRSLDEWLDLYRDAPEEHFEDGPFDIAAIGTNLVEKFGFKPTIAFHMG